MTKKRSFVAGDLMQEIQEQDLMAPVGGATNDNGDEAQSALSCFTAVTALTFAVLTWGNDIATKKYKCGYVATISAECSSSGKPC